MIIKGGHFHVIVLVQVVNSIIPAPDSSGWPNPPGNPGSPPKGGPTGTLLRSLGNPWKTGGAGFVGDPVVVLSCCSTCPPAHEKSLCLYNPKMFKMQWTEG